MEDFAVDFVFDKGAHARSHRIRLERFSLVGATTRVGLLSSPLRDRFGIFRSLDFYREAELVQITRRSAALLDIAIDKAGAQELSRRSRGTPRIVNRLLKRVRDYAQVRADGAITQAIVNAALLLEGVDEYVQRCVCLPGRVRFLRSMPACAFGRALPNSVSNS